MAYIDENLMPNEEVVYRTRLHWIVFLRPAVVLVLLVLMVVELSSEDLGLFPDLIVAITVVLFPWFLVEGLASLSSYLTSEFGVTSRRVILKVGWLERKTGETALEKVESVGVDQGVIGRIFGYGTVTIAETGRSTVPFHPVAQAMEFGEHVYQQIEGRHTQASPEAYPTRESRSPITTTRLLAVDDEPDVLELLKSLLESLGCEVHAFSDSWEATQEVDRQKYDAVFLDARMPHIDGFELAKRIRSSPSNSGVPIVMLTGIQDLETMRAAVRAGITLFVTKPFNATQLRGLLNALSGHIQAEKRRYARLPLLIVVDCRVGMNQFKSTSLNISQGGMLLEGSGGSEVGRELDLQFLLPGGPEALNPRAKVVRREPPERVAVRFLPLSLQDQDSLQRFIEGGLEN